MDHVVKSAAELRITAAEYTAVLEVRDLFARGVFHHDLSGDADKPNGFNMGEYSAETECGTTCCIGGWIWHAMRRDRTCLSTSAFRYVYFDRSKALLPLFFPFYDANDNYIAVDDRGYEYDVPDYHYISPACALKAIDNFLETGDPKWVEAAGVIEGREVEHA